jgi:hypothetical protein
MVGRSKRGVSRAPTKKTNEAAAFREQRQAKERRKAEERAEWERRQIEEFETQWAKENPKDLRSPGERPARTVSRAPAPPPRIDGWGRLPPEPRKESPGKAELQNLESAVWTCEQVIQSVYRRSRFHSAKWNAQRTRWEEIQRPQIDKYVNKCREAGVSDHQEFVELLERVDNLDRDWPIVCQLRRDLAAEQSLKSAVNALASPENERPAAKDVEPASARVEVGKDDPTNGTCTGTVKSETNCTAWLLEIMQQSPKKRTKIQKDLLPAARAKWPGLSKRSFHRAWASATRKYPEWRQGGAPRKQ